MVVSGAAGFVGSHLLDLLEARGIRTVAWRRPGEPMPLPPTGLSADWIEIDILDAPAVASAIETLRPSAVYHLAGAAHVGQSWDNTELTFQVNVLGTHHLLRALSRVVPDCRVVVTGSALVYKDQARAITEDDALGPGSPYGLSKLAQEMEALYVARHLGLPVVVTRSFNHIGPRQAPSFFASSVSRQIAQIEAGTRPPVLRVGNLEARRDLSDVRDVVRAYALLMAGGTPGQVYNVCRGEAHRVGDILEGLVSQARVPVEVCQDPALFRPHDAPLVLGDHARLTGEVGWRPEIPLDRTLGDLLAYWRAAEQRR